MSYVAQASFVDPSNVLNHPGAFLYWWWWTQIAVGWKGHEKTRRNSFEKDKIN